MPLLGGQSRANATGILMKEYPDHKMHSAINQKTPFWDRIRGHGYPTLEGTNFSIPLETAFSDAGGDRSELDDVPAPDKMENRFATFNFTSYQRTIRLSGEVLSSGGTIIDPLFNEVSGCIRAANLDRERSFFVPSSNILATMSASAQHTSATVLEVDSKRLLNRNMRVDILVSADGTTANGVVNSRITLITENTDGTAEITLEDGVLAYGSIGATYAVYRTATRNKGSWGLTDIVSASDPAIADYGGIDRDSVTEWQAQSLSADDKTLSGSLLASIITQVEIASGQTPTVIWCHPWIKNDLIAQVVKDKRWNGETMKLDPWGRIFHFEGIPVLTSRFHPPDKVHVLYEPAFRLAHPKGMGQGHWVLSGDSKGTMLLLTNNKWAWQALWVSRTQLVCTMCNAQGVLTSVKNAKTGTV